MAISNRIRKARLEILGLTQEELAVQLDVLAAQVSRWERGTVAPRPGNLRRLAVLAGKPVSWFYEDEQVAA